MSDHPRPEPDEDSLDEGDEEESWLREAVRAPLAPRLPVPGDLVGGKYRIEQLLGRGGMGVVFRARHTVSEKPVAIKWMLRPTTDEQARRRFEREARAAGRIDHPNVVALFDIGEEGECSYLVMELLRGESLRRRLGLGVLEPRLALDLLIPAMRGVAAAHRAGVIHRDLKPDNIFLCLESDGSPREAKVLDFGISSIISLEAADSTLTQEGTLLGSLGYMSPEQLTNPHEVDARTDVYAFGVILYEVLTGRLPFQGVTHSAMILAIATSYPVPPSQVQSNVSSALETIVLRALAREPRDRYKDMSSLIDALVPYATPARLSGGMTVSIAPPVRTTAPSERSAPHAPSSENAVLPTPLRDEDSLALRLRKGPLASRSRMILIAVSLLSACAFWAWSTWYGKAERAERPLVPATSAEAMAEPEERPLPQARSNDIPSPAPALAPLPERVPALQPDQAGAASTAKTKSVRATRSRAGRPTHRPRSGTAPENTKVGADEDSLFSGRK